MAPAKGRGMRKRGELAEARNLIDKALVKGMANALRNQILAILGERKGSAIELSKELGINYWQVNYEMEVLRKAKLIRKVGQRKRRGATEVFYEATARAYLDQTEWPTVAEPIKAGLRASLFHNLLVDAATAILEEIYDSLESAHMSWSPLIVDQQGWEELVALLERTLKRVLKIHDECAVRLIANDAEGISCTVSILGYPSAIRKRKVGLPLDVAQLVDFTSSVQPHVEKPPEQRVKSTKVARKSSTSKKSSKATGKGKAHKTAPKPKKKAAGNSAPKSKRKDAGK